MRAYLRIKIKSLAAEAAIIRVEERRHNPGTRARKRARRILSRTNELPEAERRRLERVLRQPSARAMDVFWGLRTHRTQDVRQEARAAQLALAFIRGRSRASCEPTRRSGPRHEPQWSRVEALVRKYGDFAARERLEKLDEWRDAPLSSGSPAA